VLKMLDLLQTERLARNTNFNAGAIMVDEYLM
jgi:hypothetical protein